LFVSIVLAVILRAQLLRRS